MHTSNAQQLLSLNRNFYNTFATNFSASRSRLQTGITKALAELQRYDSILDVGCGDGRVLAAIRQHEPDSRYMGLDFSRQLLNKTPTSPHCNFIHTDITSPNWSTVLRSKFDAAICFSVLHHIPGQHRRIQLLRNINTALKPRTLCALSVWQFLQLSRFRRKIVPWEQIGLTKTAVDPGDYLLDWHRGGHGLRYVHHFEPSELHVLCTRAGFKVVKSFHSDGENNALGFYVVLRTVG